MATQPQAILAGRGRAFWYGLLIVGGMTAAFIFWLLSRLFFSGAWLAQLPDWLQEIIDLLEWASGLTIVFLWVAIWWRLLRRAQEPPLQALDVAALYALSPDDFERYVGRLFKAKGYRVFMRGKSGDKGVDLVLLQPSGRRAIVQCKRYRHTVGAEIVRELFGTLIHERAVHAFLVTTADISDAAREWAADKPITLIDGPTLAEIASAFEARAARRAS